ncbi:hypothetical protein ACFSTI_19525 [Rhizorhabdus histidinilytica]|uniref:Uncharacterized protein n=1 Tax=Rhizorhabdus histidinilytica TaxID=439228 RepID=A0A1T5BXL5_9SPHN|nr:hypothetical protein [Rhizorhabdus histidinilytica]SKB51884.1 hypothetical protein SAMN06295920_103363 [Rhizorhabdus histidinilytica]
MTEQCNRCRFWLEDMTDRDPNDPDFGFGRCRLRPPVVSETYVAALMPRLAYGRQEDPDMDTTSLVTASLYPATFSADWCGCFKPMAQPTSVIQQQLARWFDAYRELHALDDGASEEDQAPFWAIIDDAAERIMANPSGSLGDVAAKLRVNLIHTVSTQRDHDIVAGRIDDDRLSDAADLNERGIFAAIVELERGL